MSYIDEKNEGLLVIAYPEISEKDKKWIGSFRKKNDPIFYDVVEPHFTLVFPTFGIDACDFEKEVADRIKGIKQFDFSLRFAMLNNDQLSEYYHIFLVPDEGNSNIVKLHDRLYSGNLLKNLNLDIDFISHIGIGCMEDPARCKTEIDVINLSDIEIKGTVSSLTIVSYGDKKIKKLSTLELEA